MAQRANPREFLERKLPTLWEVMRPVIAAALLVFILDLVLDPPQRVRDVVGLAIIYPVGVGFALLVGYWLGRYEWPRRGRRMAMTLLKRDAESKHRPLLFLTDRPDFDPTLVRRILEVVGFATGVSILVPAVLQILEAPPALVQLVGGLITLLALWGSFLLVPYWIYGRLGIRRVDPVRWTVEPLSLGYADRLRLSNGALLLIAGLAAFNLAYRAGASRDEALVDGVLTVVQLVASILVAATAAVVYYARGEKQLVRDMEEQALLLGIKDGRGMSDGEFLPRIVKV